MLRSMRRFHSETRNLTSCITFISQPTSKNNSGHDRYTCSWGGCPENAMVDGTCIPWARREGYAHVRPRVTDNTSLKMGFKTIFFLPLMKNTACDIRK